MGNVAVMNNINDSYNYVSDLQSQQGDNHHSGEILTGVAIASYMHHRGNKNRQRMGLPAEPMNKWASFGIAGGLGYVFWWLPIAVYMLLDFYVFHIHLISVIATVTLFIGLWAMFKRRRARKYNEYYANYKPPIMRAEDYHAPMSTEWFRRFHA